MKILAHVEGIRPLISELRVRNKVKDLEGRANSLQDLILTLSDSDPSKSYPEPTWPLNTESRTLTFVLA